MLFGWICYDFIIIIRCVIQMSVINFIINRHVYSVRLASRPDYPVENVSWKFIQKYKYIDRVIREFWHLRKPPS